MAKKVKPPLQLSTLGEVADLLGVSMQTVKQWRINKEDRMPGEPGKWPVKEIVQWRIRNLEQRRQNISGDDKTKLELEEKRIKNETLLLKLQKARAEVIDVAFVTSLLGRHINEHNALADQMKDQVIMSLPEKMDRKSKNRIMRQIEKSINDLRNTMVASIEEWEKELLDIEGAT